MRGLLSRRSPSKVSDILADRWVEPNLTSARNRVHNSAKLRSAPDKVMNLLHIPMLPPLMQESILLPIHTKVVGLLDFCRWAIINRLHGLYTPYSYHSYLDPNLDPDYRMLPD